MPFTSTVYLVSGIIFAVVFLFTFLSSRRRDSGAIRDVAMMFLFLSGYSFSLSLPFYYNSSDLGLMAYGYILAMVFVFLTMLVGIRVQLFISGKSWKFSGFLPAVLISLAGLFVIFLLLADLRLPIINSAGVVVWNVDPLAGLVAGIVTSIYGIAWAYYFLKASAMVGRTAHKIKMLSLGGAGLIFGVLGYFKFTAEAAEESALAVGIFLAATATLALILLILRFFESEE